MSGDRLKFYKRGNVFINWKVQLTIVGYATLFSILSAGFTIATGIISRSYDDLGQKLPLLVFAAIWAVGTLLFTLLIIIGFILTHRVCGPIYRLHKFFLDAIEGKATPPMKLRKNDDYSDMIEDFNRFTEHLQKGQLEQKK